MPKRHADWEFHFGEGWAHAEASLKISSKLLSKAKMVIV
jgi:hypothetical protein